MYERFRALLDSRGITPYRVARDLKMSATTFSDWKSGKSSPKLEKLKKIAAYFGVPPEYFFGDDPVSPPPAQPRPAEYDAVRQIPVAAPGWHMTDDGKIAPLGGFRSANTAEDGDYYFIPAPDGSMRGAGILEGSLVLLKSCASADDGDIVICRSDDKVLPLRRFAAKGDMAVLTAEETGYEPVAIPLKNFLSGRARILFTAVECVTPLKRN